MMSSEQHTISRTVWVTVNSTSTIQSLQTAGAYQRRNSMLQRGNRRATRTMTRIGMLGGHSGQNPTTRGSQQFYNPNAAARSTYPQIFDNNQLSPVDSSTGTPAPEPHTYDTRSPPNLSPPHPVGGSSAGRVGSSFLNCSADGFFTASGGPRSGLVGWYLRVCSTSRLPSSSGES